MAQVVKTLGEGTQRWAERVLQWNRVTVRKGVRELADGTKPTDDSHLRGRKPVTHRYPHLHADIRKIVEPNLQQDPTFRTTQTYRRVTAENVRTALIELDDYSERNLPSLRAINNSLNKLDFRPRKVAKSKPRKKIKQTDAIFERIHLINAEADNTPGVLRLSLDGKAAIKVGPFSRGGYNRRGEKACDHDFKPTCILQLFGIFLPGHHENYFFFNESRVTADAIVDALELIWPILKECYAPVNKLVLNFDNGPENHSRRTQFLKRMVDFSVQETMPMSLV